MEETEKEILYAINNGVNYFDTAYIYPGSEAALGEILERNKIRNKVYIATKLPHYLLKKNDDLDRLFNEQLKRLRTDYVDFYLMHMLPDSQTWERLKSMGIIQWLNEKKASGVIKQIGFSYHGNTEAFCQLLEVYDWDFCQIQYNYLDEYSQAGVSGLKKAAEKNIPVVIMEPLRGGRLANKLPADAIKIFKHYDESKTPAEWAFQWLWNQPEVTCVLSGMNSLEMIKENVRTASKSQVGGFGESENQLFKSVVEAINKNMKVGCTGCRYCMPCPKSVDIPGIFSAYNRRFTEGKIQGLKEYFMCTALRTPATCASNCIKCGKCELHCPQGIKIREELENAKNALEGPVYKIASKIVRKVMHYK